MNMGIELPVWYYLVNAFWKTMAALFVPWIFTDNENRTFYEKWSGTRIAFIK